eukprot:491454-Pyramimonas_sp.AAC.2
MLSKISICKSCACDSAFSASSTAARTSCPADHICKWPLRANASPLKPADPTEHILDWYGHGAQKAE